MHQIIVEPSGKRLKIDEESKLLSLIIKNKIPISSLCGGKGICGKCKVKVLGSQHDVSPITNNERIHLDEEDIANGLRLACEVQVKGNIRVMIPRISQKGIQKILVEGIQTKVDLQPNTRKIFLKLKKPDLQDPYSDMRRITRELENQYKITNVHFDITTVKDASSALRNSDWQVTVVLRGSNRIIGVEPYDTTMHHYGLAVDIGTTTIVGYLVDLNNGKTIAIDSMLNPQVAHGEDVISRISYVEEIKTKLSNLNKEDKTSDSNHDRVINEMTKLARESLRTIITNTTTQANILPQYVYEITVVGNTAMHHFFAGLSTSYLAVSPFIPLINDPIDISENHIKLGINPIGNIHLLPVIAGFVGADCVGVMLSTHLYTSKDIQLAIDIGTNGEIMLGNREGISVCSTAAGPAFEGAHINFGMRAAEGAIEYLKIHPGTFDVEYQTIGGADPIGICGSGIVDAIAELFRIGVITRGGMIRKDIHSTRIRKSKQGREFILVPKKESGINKAITFTQKDIREVQLAKGAMLAGIEILMQRRGITSEQIIKVLIAGAFGNYIDKTGARDIGLIPDTPLNRIQGVGNAAGMGAKVTLLSHEERRQAKILARQVKYLELTIEEGFQRAFIDAMYFPHRDLTKYPRVTKKLGLDSSINSYVIPK